MADVHGIMGQIGRIREKANALIEMQLKNRRIKGIVPAHGAVLAFLFRQSGPVAMKAIVEDVKRVKSTVTVMIDTLEEHGYVRRLPCTTDCRVTHVELTPKGRRLRKDFEEISQALLSQLYGDMSEKDRERLVNQLERIEENLSK
jgi:DNA-binding MarR family transcriptional regulator